VSLEEKEKVAQKQNKCGHPLKQFQSVYEDLSAIFGGGEESDSGGGVAEILVTVNDGPLSSVLPSLHPLVRELNGPSELRP